VQQVKIESFSGEIPRVSDRLLPATGAQTAANTRLKSGEIRGIHRLEAVHSFNDFGIVKAYRLPDPDGVSDGYTWVGLSNREEYIFRGPLLNDKYDRYYRFGNGRPTYNTLDRIRDGLPWLWLGIPQPTTAPTISSAGGTGEVQTRFYVYTFVSAYGEEGPPSDPGTADGASDGAWQVDGMDTTVPDAGVRNIDRKRIYRTVSGFSETEFFFVAEIPLADATYSDTDADDVVVRNSLLESELWFEPPADITGAVIMPNGFFIAWAGRDVHFSETYRPHAWPPSYDLATEFDVVGAGVFGNSAVLPTVGNPYIATGVNPESTTLTKTNTVEPALSVHSIVSMPYGVLYASQNGLVNVSASGVELITRELFTKNEWLNEYSPGTLWSAQYETEYLGFYSDFQGFAVDPAEPRVALTRFDKFANVDFVQTDMFTGEVFVMRGGTVYLWDAVDKLREQYQWRSKEFDFPTPCNLGAALVEVEAFDNDELSLLDAIARALSFNRERIEYGALDTVGIAAVGTATDVPLQPPNDTVAQIKQATGGSPLVDIEKEILEHFRAVRFNVYADGVLRYSELLTNAIHTRLPAGFKATHWSFEVIGYRAVYSIAAAETPRGLKRV